LQVEQQKHPHLQQRAVALQQHGDIIAANAEAKAAGVRKHMPPDQARALLKKVNGVLAYVHVEEGGRISYKPYREASAKFFAMLNNLEPASVVEKGSIDEAFILCDTTGSKTGVMPSFCISVPYRWHACCLAIGAP
jgi:nucleotidyltransferase/DNA polymerase involved in DNA repair